MVSDPREVTKSCHRGGPRILELIQALVGAAARPILLTASVYFVLFLCIIGIFKLVNRKICQFIKNSQSEQSNILGT